MIHLLLLLTYLIWSCCAYVTQRDVHVQQISGKRRTLKTTTRRLKIDDDDDITNVNVNDVIDDDSSTFQFHVAPMQGYTNAAMRQFFHTMSPDTVLWTEMEKLPDLINARSDGLQRRFGVPGHKDIVLQLGGNDPMLVRDCLSRLSTHGYSFREINLNCGCPSIETGGAATYGASLMRQPELTRDVLSAIHESIESYEKTQVSLKCRIGVLDTPEEIEVDGHRTEQQYEELRTYLDTALDAGISHVALHARPAVLSGLSPTKNRQIPKLNYDIVERISKDIPTVKVTLNGGISNYSKLWDVSQSLKHSPVSSFMAGRWLLRRPLDLIEVQRSNFSSSGTTVSDSKQCEILRDSIESYGMYVKQCVQQIIAGQAAQQPALHELCLPLFLASEQLREDYNRDEQDEDTDVRILFSYEEIELVYDTICEIMVWLQDALGGRARKEFSRHSMEFKKLSTSFKGMVGTKVVNKWKRNRLEL